MGALWSSSVMIAIGYRWLGVRNVPPMNTVRYSTLLEAVSYIGTL
jgi:hypothetical protein